MQKWMNDVMIARKNKVVINEARMHSEPVQSSDVIASVLMDIAQLGYTLDGEVCQTLLHLDEKDIQEFHEQVVTALRTQLGAHVHYQPLFKTFPHSIPDDREYLTRRVLGFVDTLFGLSQENFSVLSCGHVVNHTLFDLSSFGACPVCQMQVPELMSNSQNKPQTATFDETTPLTVLTLGSKEQFMDLFNALCTANTPLSESDRNVVIRTVEHFPQEALFETQWDTITQKETIAILAGEFIHQKNVPFHDLQAAFSTTTDVVRVAAYLSSGDVSLKDNTRFQLTKRERKIVLRALERVVVNNIENDTAINVENDLMRYKEVWKRLAHHVHVGAFRHRFPHAYSMLENLRNSPETLKNGAMATLVEHLIVLNQNTRLERTQLSLDKESTIEQILMEAQTQPGMFGRFFDAVLRNSGEYQDNVINTFKQTAHKLTTVNLLKMVKLFEQRNKPMPFRFFIPKGRTANIKIFESDERLTLSHDVIERVCSIIWSVINERFQKQSSMGDVYISPELKNYLIPTSQRSATEQLQTLTRGSRVSIGDNCQAIRLFLHWQETLNSGRVDVDLSAVSFDEHWQYQEHLSFTRLSSNNGCHSGDIQSAPYGASEFIDLNIDAFLNNGHRYIVMNCLSYTRQNFNQFEAFAGFMEREQVGSDELYDPKTVQNKFALNGDTINNVPMIIDLKQREIIWADLSLKGSFINTVESNSKGINLSGQVIEQMHHYTFNVYELLMAHAQQKATSIDHEFSSEKDYDFVFDESFGMNIDEIASQWLE